MTLDTIQEYIRIGELNGAIQLANILNPVDKYRILNQIGVTYEKKAQFQKLVKFADDVIEGATNDDIIDEVLGALINKSIAFIRLFEYDLAEKTIEEAVEHIKNNLDEEKNNNFLKYESSLYNVQGLLYRYLGDVNIALKYYNKSLEIRRSLNATEDVAISLANISTVYQIKGELGKALDHNLEAMQIFMEYGNKSYIAYCLHDIAITYRMKGDLLLAQNFYLKALDTRRTLDNRELLSETLYEIIQLALEMNDLIKARQYFDELKQLGCEIDSKIIALRYKISNGSIIKFSNRIVARSNAQKIFEEIANEDMINHELTVFVHLNLCELLLYEYKLIRNEVILFEIRKITDILVEIAKLQKSYSLLSKTYILLYRLSLIELDLNKAQTFLSLAEITAKEHHLENLLEFIINEQKLFSIKMGKYNSLINNNLLGKIEEENFHETIDLLIKRKNVDSNNFLSIDESVFILILNSDGISLFTKSFNENVIINKNLIGGFLMASDLGLSNAINVTSGSIESIKYGKYNIIFQKINDITCCYAFVGPSHLAIERLSIFLDKLKNNIFLWELLHKKIIRPKLISKNIIELINSIFS